MNGDPLNSALIPTPLYNRVTAVTGGIASGKSTVCEILSQYGAKVVSADDTAREVVAPGGNAITEIRAIFGDSAVRSDGTLNRQALGKIVFNDAAKRAILENLVHPLIRRAVDKKIGELLAAGEKFVVYDVPLLFEAGLERLSFKAIIVVATDPEIAKLRLIARDGFSESDAALRISSQLAIEEKIKRAKALSTPSFIIKNNETLAHLKREITALIPKLI